MKQKINVKEELTNFNRNTFFDFSKKLTELRNDAHFLDLNYKVKDFDSIKLRINKLLREISKIANDEIYPSFEEKEEIDTWDIDYVPTPVEKIVGIDDLLKKNPFKRNNLKCTPESSDKILNRVFGRTVKQQIGE